MQTPQVPGPWPALRACALLGTVFLGSAVSAEISYDDHAARLERIAVDGGTLAYMDIGPEDAPALLLIHGVPTSSYLFREVGPMIAEGGYRVIAPDLLGAGASDKPVEPGVYASDRQAARLVELMDAEGLNGAVVVLHDVGGVTGWQLLQNAPDRIDGLVVTNTVNGMQGVTPAPMVTPIMSGQATPRDVFGGLGDGDAALDATREWMDMGYPGEETAPDALVEIYAGPLRDGGAEAYVQFFEAAIPAFMGGEAARRDAQAAFDGPTAIVFGTQDKYFDADVIVPDFQAALGTPDEAITLIPEAGHFLQEQTPEAYADAILAFMEANFPR